MFRSLLVFLLLVPAALVGQSPVVPSHFTFGDIKIKLNERVREEIQDDVNALTGSQKYFKIKVDRADLYLPIIERILKEEKVPDDFKYLCIQESALIPDAVSSSNAVGFWQFKKPSGLEVGLRIDSWIDERMNIVSSTRAASTYLKKHNAEFDNWIYALLSYNTGLTGSKKYVQGRYFGAKKMELNKNIHWYVKKFLAHKFAYEYGVGKNNSPDLTLAEYTRGKDKDLKAIARETSTSYNELSNYNLWLRRSKVPGDKAYTVILPIRNGRSKPLIADNLTVRPEVKMDDNKGRQYPIISSSINGDVPYIVKINGLSGLLAKEGDQMADLAGRGKVSNQKLLKYNDISSTHDIQTGQVYYLESKRNKARLYFHTVTGGETMWSVSQKFGIKLKKLHKLNRMTKSAQVEMGRVLWLRKKRPKDREVEYRKDLFRPSKSLSEQQQVTAEPTNESRSASKSESANDPLPPESASPELIITDNRLVGTQIHTVEKGETLYSISRLYGISVSQVASANDFGPDEVIGIGQKITVPSSAQPTGSEDGRVLFHEVIPGDNLYQIARKYGISIEEIIEWNEKTNHQIQVGEKILIVSPQ